MRRQRAGEQAAFGTRAKQFVSDRPSSRRSRYRSATSAATSARAVTVRLLPISRRNRLPWKSCSTSPVTRWNDTPCGCFPNGKCARWKNTYCAKDDSLQSHRYQRHPREVHTANAPLRAMGHQELPGDDHAMPSTRERGQPSHRRRAPHGNRSCLAFKKIIHRGSHSTHRHDNPLISEATYSPPRGAGTQREALGG